MELMFYLLKTKIQVPFLWKKQQHLFIESIWFSKKKLIKNFIVGAEKLCMLFFVTMFLQSERLVKNISLLNFD